MKVPVTLPVVRVKVHNDDSLSITLDEENYATQLSDKISPRYSATSRAAWPRPFESTSPRPTARPTPTSPHCPKPTPAPAPAEKQNATALQTVLPGGPRTTPCICRVSPGPGSDRANR